MTFHVGQKVVCVDASGEGLGRLVERRVYHVTALCPPGPNGIAGIRVDGAISPVEEEPGCNKGWKVTRFRPVQERKTDIGFAHEILRKVTRKDRVRA